MKLNIGVVGCGAIGSILSAHLVRAGNWIHVVDVLRPHAERIAKNGIIVSGKAALVCKPTSVSFSVDEMLNKTRMGPPLDYLFLVTRFGNLDRAIPEVNKVMNSMNKCFCVAALNGLDTHQILIDQQVPKERILRGLVNFSGKRIADGHVRMTTRYLSPSLFGAVDPSNSSANAAADKLVAALNESGVRSSNPKADLRKYEYEKAIKNASVGPVCALSELTLHQCLDTAGTLNVVKLLFNEGMAVARADGFRLTHEFYESSVDYFRQAVNDDRSNKPMMAMDLEAGLPTEVKVLNERIAQLGDQMGVPTPVNRDFASMIRAIEIRNRIANKISEQQQKEKTDVQSTS